MIMINYIRVYNFSFWGVQMNFKLRDLIIFIIFTFFVGFLGAYTALNIFTPKLDKSNLSITNTGDNNISNEQLQKVMKTFNLINEHFIEDVNEDELFEGAINGMIDSLEDPYSSYMDVESMERFNEQIHSSFQGIGAEVTLIDGNVTIVSPIKNSPAEKAGLRPNDQILKVDEESLEGLDLHEAVEKIRGEKGSEVILLVQRAGQADPFEVSLIRDDIPIETVHADTKDVEGKKTGILNITSFSETTADEFTSFLTEMEDDGIEGLIIDVRGNPGGLLDSIEDILKQFVPKDIPYLQREDRSGEKQKYYSTLDEKKPYPISVLIDEGSASASEILAVAMKEVGYDIVGKTSFGKGTVQQAVPLGDGSTIKLTFYKWLSPKGNWINEVGVEPTIEQKQPDLFYVSPVKIEEPFNVEDKSDKIETIQTMLSGIGFADIRSDGYFDTEMEKIIRTFQEDNDLDVTGEVDKETYAAIEMAIIEEMREEKNDLQLNKALETLYK